MNWDKLGDWNTKYFHQKENQRQKRNCLYGLEDDHGVRHEDRGGIEDIVVSYFSRLFTSNGVHNLDEILSHISPSVTEEMNALLESPFTNEEIKCAVFQMHPMKATGPNGMSPGFYQK